MDLDVLQGLLKTIIEDHKADIRFFTGLKKDFDNSHNKKYPAIIVNPVTDNFDVGTQTNSNSIVDTWNIEMQIHVLIPVDRSADNVNAVLNSTNLILKQIINRFLIRYGQEERDFTFNNKVQRINFKAATVSVLTSTIDEVPNNTIGWTATLSILDEDPSDACCDDGVFNTVLPTS